MMTFAIVLWGLLLFYILVVVVPQKINDNAINRYWDQRTAAWPTQPPSVWTLEQEQERLDRIRAEKRAWGEANIIADRERMKADGWDQQTIDEVERISRETLL